METDPTFHGQIISFQSYRKPYVRFVKPTYDRLFGLILGVLTLPILLALLAVSWLVFGWAPLRRVTRMGRHGRRFNLYRINTRRDHYTDLRGRERRVSAWLRRTSLDELPQLWNVAFGHMSLVGPRPLDPITSAELGDSLRSRHRIRPGLTGPWQVSARGNGRSMTDHVHEDLAYAQEVSLGLDLSLLARTIPALIRRREEV